MWKEIFGLVGIYAVFRFILAGPAHIEEQQDEDEWDQIPVSASHIDHDLAVFSGPDDSIHPDHIGRLRNLQENRNMMRATEARPMLDQMYITKDNNRKLEVIIE
jgi:hypothetical protein